MGKLPLLASGYDAKNFKDALAAFLGIRGSPTIGAFI
jgi:hypothetical protein